MRATGLLSGLQQEGALAGLRIRLHGDAARLRGHASMRRFFRVRTAPARTAILVVYPSEDGAGSQRYRDTAAWFAAAGVRVPRVLDAGHRALLVEDGGDELLDAVRDEPRRKRLYRQAIDGLGRLQRHGRRVPVANPEWALDGERLRRELEFTEEHALRGWLGASRRDAAARAAWFDRLVAAVAALPKAACHRDYHARNLLAGGDRLMVLDFQDVMTGPFLYDLVSLLWDNYCDLPGPLTREMSANFWGLHGESLRVSSAAAVPALSMGLPPAARQAFALVGLQRSLKALGTFGYQVTRAGNVDYARFGPRTWRHARTALRQLGWDDLLGSLGAFDQLGGEQA